ncbi:MAG: PEGA domain-containing protein [Deltaproteobacteria bacterium]|nr:PEGA domain-containing protein [Deltaproteobacteria bacterium]
MCKFVIFFVALGAVLTADPALAKRRVVEKKFVVLVRLEKTVPGAWEKEIQDAAQAAAVQKRGIEWMPPPQVSLEESRTLLGCQSYDAKCIAQIADTLGAARALYVEVTASEGKPTMLGLVSVAVRAPNRAQWRQVELPSVDAAGLAVTKAFVRGEVLEQPPAVLVVTSDVAGAHVVVDGKPAGVTPLALTENLKVGAHEVLVDKSGHQSVMRRIEVQRGRLAHLQVSLPAVAATAAVAIAPPVASPEPKVIAAVTPVAPPVVKPESGVVTPPTPAPSPAATYPHWESPVAWVGVGLGAVGLVAAGTLYSVHQYIGWDTNENHLFDNDDSNDPVHTLKSDLTLAQMKERRGQLDGTYVGTLASLGVGLVLVVTGSAFFFLPLAE